MTTPTLDQKVDDFLAQKRIAVAGVSRHNGRHPVGNLIYHRIVRDCQDAGVRRVWMHQSMGKGTSVSPEAVEYCRQHGISVIGGACPMMYGAGADVGHTCMRWILRFTGGLPT